MRTLFDSVNHVRGMNKGKEYVHFLLQRYLQKYKSSNSFILY